MAIPAYILACGRYPRLVIEHLNKTYSTITLTDTISWERRDTEIVVFHPNRVEHFPLTTIVRYAVVDSRDMCAKERTVEGMLRNADWAAVERNIMDATEQAVEASKIFNFTGRYGNITGRILRRPDLPPKWLPAPTCIEGCGHEVDKRGDICASCENLYG
jgi:hypothetical protein